MPNDHRAELHAHERDKTGVVVRPPMTVDTKLGFDEPNELLSEDQRLRLDQDIARLHQHRQKAVTKARGIRLS